MKELTVLGVHMPVTVIVLAEKVTLPGISDGADGVHLIDKYTGKGFPHCINTRQVDDVCHISSDLDGLSESAHI